MKRLLLLLVIFTTTVIHSQNADINLLRKINFNESQFQDAYYKGISKSVGPLGLATPVSLIATGLITKNKTTLWNGYKSGASILLASGIATGLKFAVKRTRPFVTYPDLHKKASPGPLSFPSGHTTMAFATATSLCLSYPKWYVIAPSALYAFSVAYSRMYLGVHYPSDVLGGMIIGIGTSFIVWRVEKWINK